MILVEHDMRMVMDIADSVLVLDFGEPIAIGTPDEVQSRPRVIGAYLGRCRVVAPHEDTDLRCRAPPGRPRRLDAAGTARSQRARRRPTGSPCARRTSASGGRSPGPSTGPGGRSPATAYGARRRARRPGGRPLPQPSGVGRWPTRRRRASGRIASASTRPTRPPRSSTCSGLAARRCSSPRTRNRSTRRWRCGTGCRHWSGSSYIDPRGVDVIDDPELMTLRRAEALGRAQGAVAESPAAGSGGRSGRSRH